MDIKKNISQELDDIEKYLRESQLKRQVAYDKIKSSPDFMWGMQAVKSNIAAKIRGWNKKF